MKTFLIAVYYELLTFVRVKVAVFFTFIFPVFIYVIFILIWGNGTPGYARFLLTGVIGMTIISDALFSVGNVVTEYEQTGEIRFFKVIPYSFQKLILALLVSRLLLLLVSAAWVMLIGCCFFGLAMTAGEIGFLALSMGSGFILFSFLSVLLALATKNRLMNVAVTNFVFFILLFLSDTFYPMTELNPELGKWVSWLPIAPVLALSRGSEQAILPVMLWIGGLVVAFGVVWKKKKTERG